MEQIKVFVHFNSSDKSIHPSEIVLSSFKTFVEAKIKKIAGKP